MLATHAPSPSLHLSPVPTTKLSLPSTSRLALADSTNVNFHAHVPSYPKSLVYPTSFSRTSCGWSDVDSSTSCHSRNPHWSSSPSLFPVTQKAPPTVSISLSAVCSQSTPGDPLCGPRVQGSEPDLPDVKSVVPFPSGPLDGDMDVEMLDGTCVPCPDGHSPSAGRAPRKRRSANSSVSSSQSSLGKGAKPKRQRKSKQQVAELLWLGVVCRSILRGIEARQSVGEPSLPGPHDFDTMDCLLVEKIQRRLVESGCAEGRVPPNPLPRISSSSISVPSLNLSPPCALPTVLNSKDGRPLPPASSSPCSCSPILSSTSASHKPHVRFEIPPRPRQPRLSIPRRSPSPPARTGTTSASAQTLTLTMPQLVASLTLAHRDRRRPRLRGRPYQVNECGKNAGRSSSSVAYQDVQRGDGDVTCDMERMRRSFTPRARASSATERRSPLSRVAYAES